MFGLRQWKSGRFARRVFDVGALMVGLSIVSIGGHAQVMSGRTIESDPPGKPPGATPSVQTAGKFLGALGLPRLREEVLTGDAAPLVPARFEVDPLVESGRAVKSVQRGTLRTLELEGGSDWSRPLRGDLKETVFISVLVYGSIGTRIEFAGLEIKVVESPVRDSVQIMAPTRGPRGDTWKSTGVHVPIEVYSDRPLAALPVLTARVDPATGAWDLFAGMSLVASGQQASDASIRGARRSGVRVVAGEFGGWVCGLVQSSENPLYEDENRNGIDDGFETRKRGRLLRGDEAFERALLAESWRVAGRTQAQSAMLFDRPRSDKP